MDNTIKSWNEMQKKLKTVILTKKNINKTINIILIQHQLVHASEMVNLDNTTFEDELWTNLSEDDFRRIPNKSINSIAWHLWHSARIEDITVSFLIANLPQVLETENYYKTLNIDFKDTGNSMNIEEMKILSTKINMEELRQYQIAVGKRTQEIIKSFTPEILNTKVSVNALEKIRVKGAVLKDASWLLDFWGKKKIAGIVLMPLTRHLMVHINKSKRLIRKRNQKS
ncbi:MAG: DinB family protein [Candidatus Methanofastidiosia archaeon]